jgi:hypothetical protein
MLQITFIVIDVDRKCNIMSDAHANEVHGPEDSTEGLVFRWRQGHLVLVGRDFFLPIVSRCHGRIRGRVVQHAVVLKDLLYVSFLGENDGPCFFASCNIHPEDELGLTKIRHAELLPNGPLHRLNQFERFKDDENVVHIYQYNTY